MPETVLLEMTNVSKIHGSRLLFKNLSLSFKKGEGALLTGANGTGKSTLLRLAAGLSKPSQGKIRRGEKTAFAFLGHATFLYPALSALENLAFWQALNPSRPGVRVLEEVLDLVGLLPYAHEQTRNFSRGMAQRLNFARVFLTKADLLLLDEPFSGVDQKSRQIILEELLRRKQAGAALFIVSHDPQGDSALTDKIYLLDKKRLILAQGQPAPQTQEGTA